LKILFGKGILLGPISGADEVLTAYATQLHQAGHNVSVLLMFPHALSNQYYLRLRDAGVHVSSIAPARMRVSVDAGRRLARRLLQVFPSSQGVLRRRAREMAFRYYDECRDYFKRERPDLIHVISPDPGAMVMIRAAHDTGISVLYQEVGKPYHPPGFESYYEQFTSVLPLCTEVAALSPQLAQECREKSLAKRISVLPILSDDRFNREAAAVNHREASRKGVTFGFAARLERLKGPLELMDAFATTRQQFADVRLQIAGDGVLKAKTLARAQALGIRDCCEFHGVYTQAEEKSAFMKSLDVFVLPSLTEGTPNCIIEAMACGIPVISTNVGGIPDVVNSKTGILVSPGDTEALAEAMCRLAADAALRARMGRAAREQYEKLFNPSVVLPLMLHTYSRVAAGKGDHSAPTQPNGNGLMHPWAHSDV
jgi:glycosyltransferase involved in cell wall biosynthesis